MSRWREFNLPTLAVAMIIMVLSFYCGTSGGSSGTTTTAGPVGSTTVTTVTVMGTTTTVQTMTTVTISPTTTTTLPPTMTTVTVTTQTITTITTLTTTTTTLTTTTLTTTSTTDTSVTYTTVTTRTTTLTTTSLTTTTVTTTLTTQTTRTTTTQTTRTTTTMTTSTVTTRTTTTRTTTTVTTVTTQTTITTTTIPPNCIDSVCRYCMDDFDDGNGVTSKGQAWLSWAGGATTPGSINVSYPADGAQGSSNSMRADYTMGTGAWYEAEVYANLNSTTVDLSNQRVRFWAKGSGNNLVIFFRVENQNPANSFYYVNLGRTRNTWSYYDIPLSSFTLSAPAPAEALSSAVTHVNQLWFFVMSSWNAPGETGYFQVDELHFAEQSCAMGGLTTTTITDPNYVVMGYVETLRSGGVGDINTLNYGAVDYIIHGFVEPNTTGTVLTPVGNFTSYRTWALPIQTHIRGKKIIMSLGGATNSGNFASASSTAGNRTNLANAILARLEEWGYDGVDIDWEFPSDTTQRSNYTLLMQQIYNTLKAANPSYKVMFGVSTGYNLNCYQWSQLGNYTDYAFYFGYDWDDPANGPLTNSGSSGMIAACGGGSTENSIRGAVNYMLAGGFPANKIILGVPFYNNKNPTADSWFSIRSTWNSGGPWIPHASYREVLISGYYWNTPEAINAKLDLSLLAGSSVYTGGQALRGAGFWEFGHEAPANPDLSQAIRDWVDSH